MCIYNINTCTCTLVDSKATPEDMEEYKMLQNILQTTTAKYVVTDEDQKEMDSRSVYVANLHFKTSDADIRSHFKLCGSIVHIQFPKNIKTGAPKGFCFVEFEDKESVELALDFDGMYLNNRVMKVSKKDSFSKRNAPVRESVETNWTNSSSFGPVQATNNTRVPSYHSRVVHQKQVWNKPQYPARNSKFTAPKSVVNRFAPY